MNFIPPFYNLNVSDSCNLRCLGCSIWKSESFGDKEHLLEQSLQNDFFSVHPKRPFYNIVGGEPFNASFLPLLLSTLRQQSINTHVWTNLTHPFEVIEPCLSNIKRIFVFLPFSDQTNYEDYVGETLYERLLHNIDECKRRHIPIFFHTPLTSENIPWLPDIYEFVYQLDAILIIHSDKHQLGITKESQQYIKKFKRRKHVWHFQMNGVHQHVCPGLPYSSINQTTRYMSSIIYQLYLNYGGIFGGRV